MALSVAFGWAALRFLDFVRLPLFEIRQSRVDGLPRLLPCGDVPIKFDRGSSRNEDKCKLK